MRKKKSCRFLSVLLAVLLVIGLVSTTALAASGTCPSCGRYCSYTLEYEQWTSNYHVIRHWCSNCGYDQCDGVNAESHTFNSSGYCTKCGYYGGGYDDECDHSRTRVRWDGCDWEEYCRDCGEVLDWGTSHGDTYTEWDGCEWYEYCEDCDELLDWGEDHDYSYDDWEYYSSTRHRRLGTCDYCGETTYSYGNHSKKTTYVPYSSTQHQYGSYCATCQSFIGTPSLKNHTFTYGSWQSYNGTQHRRLRTCSACGYSDYEYADHNLTVTRQSISDTQHKTTSQCSVCGYSSTVNEAHSFTYGEWQSDSDTQHRRTKSCVCGYSGYDYGDHADADGDGACDSCGHLMSHFSVTIPASLSIAMDETGRITTAENAAITNNSNAAVKVSAITVQTANGWTIVPYSTNMANAKVDTKQIGFTINDAVTKQSGSSEALTLGSGWQIAKSANLPLNYGAVVSATSQPVHEQVLTLVFVLDWAN